MNRRSVLAHAAVTLTGGAAIAFAVPDMDARAVAVTRLEPIDATPADPLLALIEEYRRQMSIFNASGSQSQEDDEALAEVTYRPLFEQLREEPPAPTTMQGAVEALRLAHEEMEHTMGSMERPLVGVALAFLEGRV